VQVTELEGDVLIEARDVVGLVAACVLVERVPRVRRKLVVLDATAEGGAAVVGHRLAGELAREGLAVGELARGSGESLVVERVDVARRARRALALQGVACEPGERIEAVTLERAAIAQVVTSRGVRHAAAVVGSGAESAVAAALAHGGPRRRLDALGRASRVVALTEPIARGPLAWLDARGDLQLELELGLAAARHLAVYLGGPLDGLALAAWSAHARRALGALAA
jgi:hypothetical protein